MHLTADAEGAALLIKEGHLRAAADGPPAPAD